MSSFFAFCFILGSVLSVRIQYKQLVSHGVVWEKCGAFSKGRICRLYVKAAAMGWASVFLNYIYTRK